MFSSIPEAITDIKNGKMLIVVDDESRENEGDLVMAAEFCRPSDINFMMKVGKGLICTPLTKKMAQRFSLNPMVDSNNSPHTTAFTVSIDLIEGTTTGISSFDRSNTIQALCHPQTTSQDFYRPGHIFPLIAKDGGVLERDGHTEAAVDLTKLAQVSPVGVICEIINDDGSMARLKDLLKVSKKYDLKIITIFDLIKYQKSLETSQGISHDHL